jgi:hypothetical protein
MKIAVVFGGTTDGSLYFERRLLTSGVGPSARPKMA